jgi:DNA-directed RNA polymerase subunit RPC12/RpoP
MDGSISGTGYRCHECGQPAFDPTKLAHSGRPGVYFQLCDQCWEELTDEQRRAVRAQRSKEPVF